MSFADDVAEPDELADPRARCEVHQEDVQLLASPAVRRRLMAELVASIPPGEWFLLEQLAERTRHAVLRECLRVLVRRRPGASKGPVCR